MTAAVAADPLAAVAAVLSADRTILDLTGGRVYETELPEHDDPLIDAEMPFQCVVVKHAGGGLLTGQGWGNLGDLRFDVFTYGYTPEEARELWLAVRSRLTGLTRTTVGQVAAHWARLAGGPNEYRDPDTTWPYVVSSWQILFSEGTP